MLDSELHSVSVDELVAIDLEKLPGSVLEKWQPGIKDPALRADLIGCTRLRDRILADLFRQSGVDPSDNVVIFEGIEKIQRLLSGNPSDKFLEIGCAWHANRIAAAIASNDYEDDIAELPRAVLQNGLKFRNYKSFSKPPVNFLPETLVQEGKCCVACWAGTLPKPIEIRLGLLLDLEIDAQSKDTHSRRAQLCERFLDESIMKVAA